jgi:excisionase family DNA binding protein
VINLATTPRQTLRIQEVMELFEVSRRTIYYWIEHQKIPTVIVEGKIRIEVDELRRRLLMIDPPPQKPSFSSAHLRALVLGCTKNTLAP